METIIAICASSLAGKTELPASPGRSDAWKRLSYPQADVDYASAHRARILRRFAPMTGQPDFGASGDAYVPISIWSRSKSRKLYLMGAFTATTVRFTKMATVLDRSPSGSAAIARAGCASRLLLPTRVYLSMYLADRRNAGKISGFRTKRVAALSRDAR